ncbi:MAG: TraM recognition domain-containing protein [Planctomycetota bacterium]|nr:TraM recognition domain-containing protein [Planctomycetota bacterium]
MIDSDHPWLKRFFSKSWHKTLRQSVDNPLQHDRLPTDVTPEFNYPVVSESFSASQARTLTAVFYTLLLTVPIAFLMWIDVRVSIALVPLGFTCCVTYLAYHLTPWASLLPRVAIALVAMFCALFLMSALPLTLAALLVATIGVVVLADSIAAHGVSIATAAPTERQTAFEVRRLWSQRFTAIQQPLRGAEGYLLGIGLCLALSEFWLRFWRTPERPRDPDALLQTFLLPAAVAIGATLLLEIGLALLYGRSPASIFALIKALWGGFVDWHCYNIRNTRALGVHTTPAGPAPGRRRLLTVVYFLWLIVFSTLQAQKALAPKSRPTREPQPITLEGGPIGQSSSAGKSPTVAGDKSKTPVKLSTVEKHFLEQLSPQDQDEYLQKKIILDTASRTPEPLPKHASPSTTPSDSYSFYPEDPPSPAEFLMAPWYTRLFVYARVIAELAFRWMKLGLLSTALIATGVFVVAARALAAWDRGTHRKRVFNTANWDGLVARLQNSQDPTEQNSLLLGVNAFDDTPILVPRDVFREHAHILGDSGSGKTSLGILPLMTQLLRRGDCSVIVIDLKADDQAILETMRQESVDVSHRWQSADPRHPGYRFRWFTTALNRSSYAFNPLRQSYFSQLADSQRTDVLTNALGLQYGTDYGRKFFGDANFELLQYTFQNYSTADSFAALSEYLAGSARFDLDPETKRAATNAKSSVRRLSGCQPLNASPANKTPPAVLDAAIDLQQVFTQPQAIYFGLPSATGAGTAAEIARLVLYSLLAAAQSHTGRRVQTFVFIDEFQRIVANNLELLLQTARSMNIGLILSNQSRADLETTDANIRSAVGANTRWKQHFSVSDQQEIEELRDASGETLVNPAVINLLPGLLWGYSKDTRSFSESASPRLRFNDILLAGDAPGRSIAALRRSAGFAQFGGFPFIMDSVYHLPVEVYQHRFETPWPAANSETLFPTLDSQKVAPAGRSRVLHPRTVPDPTGPEESGGFPDPWDDPVPSESSRPEAPTAPVESSPPPPADGDATASEPEGSAATNAPQEPEPAADESDSMNFLDRIRAEQQRRDEERRKRNKKKADRDRRKSAGGNPDASEGTA